MTNQHGDFIWYELMPTDLAPSAAFYGPQEIPGGDFVVNGLDPQGAMFALIGAK